MQNYEWILDMIWRKCGKVKLDCVLGVMKEGIQGWLLALWLKQPDV